VGIAWFKFLYSIIRKFKGRTDRFCSSRQTVDPVARPSLASARLCYCMCVGLIIRFAALV